MRTDRIRTRSRGFTLLELIVVLVVVAIGTAATLSLLGPSRESARAAGFSRDIAGIVDNIRREYGMQESYMPTNGGLSLLTAISRGLIPQHLHFGSFQARDPWGRAIGLSTWPTTGSAQALHTQFSIVLSRPGNEICTAFAVSMLQLDPAEFSQVLPAELAIATPAVRPTSAAISAMAQNACAANTSVGTGTWRLVFD